MNRGDILVITHTNGEGIDFGVDAVTPMTWHVGIVTSVTRADKAPRGWRDVKGETHRVRKHDAYKFVPANMTPLYLNPDGVMAQLSAERPDGTFPTLSAAREFLREVRHSALHRTAVIRAAGF